jgi:GNAT superfamily N-acetyltransferase
VTAVWLARRDEVEVVTRLLAQFRDHMGHDWPPDDSLGASVRRLIDDPNTEYWLAAPDEGAPAAAICQLRFRHSVWTSAEDCWLEDLFVRAEARRQGLARALVQRALDRARERGCRRGARHE